METLRRGLEARPAWLDRRPGAKHAIGDAAVGIELDAFERSGASGSIEHAQLAAPPDVAKLAVLGAAASVQPAHPADELQIIEQCWPDRAAWSFPPCTLLDVGARLAIGSDAPVAPLDLWLAMAAARRAEVAGGAARQGNAARRLR